MTEPSRMELIAQFFLGLSAAVYGFAREAVARPTAADRAYEAGYAAGIGAQHAGLFGRHGHPDHPPRPIALSGPGRCDPRRASPAPAPPTFTSAQVFEMAKFKNSGVCWAVDPMRRRSEVVYRLQRGLPP